jgi:hypothetical protein
VLHAAAVRFTHAKYIHEHATISHLAIDQHRKPLTVDLRNEQRDVLVTPQLSTEWPQPRTAAGKSAKRAASHPLMNLLPPHALALPKKIRKVA